MGRSVEERQAMSRVYTNMRLRPELLSTWDLLLKAKGRS